MTVHPWSIGGITVSNLFGNTTIEAGTRLVDRMMEEKKRDGKKSLHRLI